MGTENVPESSIDVIIVTTGWPILLTVIITVACVLASILMYTWTVYIYIYSYVYIILASYIATLNHGMSQILSYNKCSCNGLQSLNITHIQLYS